VPGAQLQHREHVVEVRRRHVPRLHLDRRGEEGFLAAGSTARWGT
jgi:hypothetical protein